MFMNFTFNISSDADFNNNAWKIEYTFISLNNFNLKLINFIYLNILYDFNFLKFSFLLDFFIFKFFYNK